MAVGDLLALPGGGLEEGETIEEGLKREFREETGYLVRVLEHIGSAGQYVYAREEQVCFNKLCHFFEVELVGGPGVAVDSDHQIHWISSENAADFLTEEAHRWAVAKIANQ